MCNRLVSTIESPKQLENFPKNLFTLQLCLPHRLKQRSSSSPHLPCPPPPPPLLIIIIIIIIHHGILEGSYLGLPDAYHFFPPPSSVDVPYPLSGLPLECVHSGGTVLYSGDLRSSLLCCYCYDPIEVCTDGKSYYWV